MRLGTLCWRQNLSIQSVAFLADNQRLLTVGNTGKPRIWDLATGKVLGELELRRLGREAEASLRQLLKASPSAEASRRAEAILEVPPAWKIEDAQALRRYRAVGLLAQLQSEEARNLLKVMTTGPATAPETEAAQAVLASM